MKKQIPGRGSKVRQDNLSLRYGARLWLVNTGLVLVGLFLSFQAVASEPYKILMLGDSLTAGYGLVKGQSVPARLERALNKDGLQVTLINAGVSGDTSAGGLARLAWAMADNPDMVIIELGANDGLRGLDPKQTHANLDSIITQVKRTPARILLTGMKAPPNLGPEYGAEFNGLFEDLASRHKVAFYPFFLDGVIADPTLNQADGIHPNPDGVAVIVEKIMPMIKKIIADR